MKVQLSQDLAQSLGRLGRAVEHDVYGIAAGALDLCRGEALFDVVAEGGGAVASFSVSVQETASGRLLRVGAMGGDGAGADLVGVVVDWAHGEAKRINARHLACETRRRGLVHKLVNHGFEVSGYIMKKELV